MSEEISAGLPEWNTEVCDVGFHKINVRGYPLEDIIRNLSFAEVVYLTIRGELPTKDQARVMNAVLCGIVDHGFLAPTSVAARVVTSATPESIMPGVASGLLTVGSVTVSPQDTAELILHAYNMMKEDNLSMKDAALKAVEELRAQKRRVPGLGHPLHPTGDPRAIALKEIAQKYGAWGERAELYETIHRVFVETSGKNFPINIDGMMGCVLTELGFQPKEMAGVAAISFMPGIIAHAVEETQKIKLRVVMGGYTGKEKRELPPEYCEKK